MRHRIAKAPSHLERAPLLRTPARALSVGARSSTSGAGASAIVTRTPNKAPKPT